MNMNGRKIVFAFAVSLLLSASFAAPNDVVVTFSTPGPDRYADGTTVADGECYALVYTPEGKTFAGFQADGAETDPETGRIVLTAPVAKNGKCPNIAFEIDAAFAAENYPSGSWSVYLLDTRVFGNAVKAQGAANGRARVVNGYGLVGAASVSSGGAPMGMDGTGGGRVTRSSSVPEGTPQPKVTGIRVIDGFVYITVKDTVPYLAYEAKEVKMTGAGEGDSGKGSSVAQGEAGREITIIRPAKGSSGFFKVGRKSDD